MKELIQSVSVQALLERRNAMLKKIQEAYDLLAEAMEIAAADDLLSMPVMEIEHGAVRGLKLSFAGKAASLEREEFLANARLVIDRDAWHGLLRASGITSVMDVETKARLRDQIEKGDFPELSMQSIEATFARLMDMREQMFEEGVVNLFHRLSWDYKSNNPVKIGKKIILERVVDRDGIPGHYMSGVIDDLNRALHILDGRPEPDTRTTGTASLIRTTKGNKLEGEYYVLKWFKNGNGHLIFKRQDLVDKLNKIISKRYPNALAKAA